MTRQSRVALTLLCGLLTLCTRSPMAAEFTSARIAVYFSPSGGATDAVVREVNASTQQILVQAYSFTSAPIAKALVEAHKRGVKILAVLDKSNETEKYHIPPNCVVVAPREARDLGTGRKPRKLVVEA